MTGDPPSPAWPARTPARVSPGQADLLRSALALAGRGWHVFPCAIGGKQPALRGNWQGLATTDPAVICGWWTRRAWNIGIACGPSGLVVLDLDVPKDPRQPHVSGITSLARLCQQARQPYPLATFTVATPSGGCHLYFTAADQTVANSASRLGPRIDVRANGGYVIGAGSMIGGRAYAVRNDAIPAPLPNGSPTHSASSPHQHPGPPRSPIPAVSAAPRTPWPRSAMRPAGWPPPPTAPVTTRSTRRHSTSASSSAPGSSPSRPSSPPWPTPPGNPDSPNATSPASSARA
jgi:hypothetical protein